MEFARVGKDESGTGKAFDEARKKTRRTKMRKKSDENSGNTQKQGQPQESGKFKGNNVVLGALETWFLPYLNTFLRP